MYSRVTRILAVTAILVGTSWLSWATGAVQAADPPAAASVGGQTRILVVHSYDPDYEWCSTISQGIADALKGRDDIIETVYLDARRHPDPAQLRQAASEALRRIEAEGVPLVIAVDDAAQQYLVEPHLAGRVLPQVIFCGVNAPLRKYNYPSENVSGVQERWLFRQAFALLKRMNPDLRRVAFLTEGSETSRSIAGDLQEDMHRNGPYALDLVGTDIVQTFQQWQERVLHWQDHADALALGLFNTLVDGATGGVVPPAEVMAWTNSVNRLPTLGFNESVQKYGILCGVLESGHEQGYLAGSMALAVLTQGIKAGSLAPRTNTRGVVLLNLKVAEQLGLRIPYELIEAAGVVLQ